MKGIKKTDFNKISALHSSLEKMIELHNSHLSQLEAVVNSAIADYMKEHGEEVESNIDAINDTQEQLSNSAQEQSTIIDDYMQERSVSWHDSAAGGNMHDWYEDWDSYSSDICSELDGYPFLSIEFDPVVIDDLPKKDRN